MTTIKTKKIYKRAIALELRKKGFNIVGTEPNKLKPQFDVYLFKDTPNFQAALTEVLLEEEIKNDVINFSSHKKLV